MGKNRRERRREEERSKWLSAFKGNLIYFVNMLLKPVPPWRKEGEREKERDLAFATKKWRRKGFSSLCAQPPFLLLSSFHL